MRQSSGKRSEKRPCETLPKIGAENSGSDKARLLLEKTHLPVNLHSTTKIGTEEALSRTARELLKNPARHRKMHNVCCFAGQLAACPGYFSNDILPCVCSSKESLLLALSQVAMPYIPIPDFAAPVMHLLPLSA
jgi:hypothetical protein